MISLSVVAPTHIDKAWKDGASCLAEACETSGGEITGDQLKLIQSELAELEEGLNNSDPIEQLDGCLDVLVTTFGYLQRMESRYGINISGASSLVGENNLSKFHTTEEEALKTVAFYTAKNVQTYHLYNPEYDLWIVRDSNTNKVKKPYFFKDVVLNEVFPKVQ